ncbi:hypothetical protein INT44_008619 [Umbelopsis vinacea]|uniref:Uncharacterized protein n=1 Tax=Umbelopsis vinacea TaxID=44442 RepID=A0A8H7PYI9_9FUNG|nr:hypothetical protein INT44_008619 [Umbelopsis vinacea]
MAAADHCPSCDADASHRQLDHVNASLIYCSNCGHVLDDTEYQHQFVDYTSRPTLDGQTDALLAKWRNQPRVFHISNGTCIELQRLAPHLQLTSEDLQIGYTYIRRYVDERRPASIGTTAVAVGYLLRRMKMKPMPLRVCASLCQASAHAVGVMYRRILCVIKPVFPQGYWDPYLYLYDAATYNYDILASQNGKRSKSFTMAALINLATEVLSTASKLLYHTGRSSSSFVVSCLLLASDVLNERAVSGPYRKRVLKQLATANLVSVTNLDMRYIELRKLFSGRAEQLPWIAGPGKKCRDPTPFIRDILKLEGVVPPKPLAEGNNSLEPQDAAGENMYENAYGLAESSSVHNKEPSILNHPPAFVKSEETRQRLEHKLKVILGEEPMSLRISDEQDLKTLAFLLENGLSKEELLNTNATERRQLEHTIQYREQFPWSYNANRDLDKATLDDEDLCDEEMNMYLRIKQDTSTNSNSVDG